MKPKGEKIADYVWLDKTQRSWHVWAGNPFCVSLHVIPLKAMSRAEIVRKSIRNQTKEKKRFAKKFPDIKW